MQIQAKMCSFRMVGNRFRPRYAGYRMVGNRSRPRCAGYRMVGNRSRPRCLCKLQDDKKVVPGRKRQNKI